MLVSVHHLIMSQDKKPRSKPQLPDTPPLGGYHKKPLFWKILIIQVLRGTIGILERMVTRLETSSSTTSEKGGLLLWVVRKWDGFLRGFRLFLPSKVANNVSDSFLTLIFVFLALLAIGVTAISLISQIHSQPVPQLGESIADSIVEDKPQPQLGERTADSIVEGKSKPELSQPATDFILRSQSEIEPVELIPQPEVTVFIEKQLKEITATSIITKDKQRIELKLVQSIKTNFRISEIVIKITEDWYKLESSQQEKLAAKILKSCQEMDLIHVKLVNARNQVIARSPVIGTKMVFFQFPTS